jgi:hypothetical protein
MDELARLHDDISTEERLRIVGDYEVAEILCAPGHRSLREPSAVQLMAEKIALGDLDQILSEPILVGIFTQEYSGGVQLRAVECLDGNHRLLAGLLCGAWRRIRDIPIHGLDARVNGWPARGAGCENRWIPLEVAEASSLARTDWSEVPSSWGAKGPTAQIPGGVCGQDAVIPNRFRSISLADLLEDWRKRC